MSASSRAWRLSNSLLAGSWLHRAGLERGEVAVHRPPHPGLFLAQHRNPTCNRLALVTFGRLQLHQGLCDEPAVPIDLDHLLQDGFLELVLRQPVRVAVARPVPVAGGTCVVVVAARATCGRGPDEGPPALSASDDPGQQIVRRVAPL
jgi:hypothetical protein